VVVRQSRYRNSFQQTPDLLSVSRDIIYHVIINASGSKYHSIFHRVLRAQSARLVKYTVQSTLPVLPPYIGMAPLPKSIRLVSAAPRAHLFTPRASLRPWSSTTVRLGSENDFKSGPFGSFGGGPAPPRLPKEEQDLFESLQRQSTGAFSTPRSPPQINQSPDASAADLAPTESTIASQTETRSDLPPSRFNDQHHPVIEVEGPGEELHPNIVRGAQPEFDGERNPKTGEIGGPKNEPLRWGPGGEWSYNGRTTDF